MSIIIKDLNTKSDQSNNYIYKDIDLFQIEGTKGKLSVTDIDSIRSSMNNLFLIKRGTRILDPEFGSNLDVYLFEQLNETNAGFLADDVEEILAQEPRIMVDSIDVLIDEDNSQYIVEVKFYAPEISKESLDMSFNLGKDTGVAIDSVKINN
jgi:phage baseplate assembly protein W